MRIADTATKAYIQKNTVFADAFNYFIYNGQQKVHPENLQEVDPTELMILAGWNPDNDSTVLEGEQKYRDILKSAVIMEDTKAAYVLLGIENQKDIHYAMPVRNMIYDALQYGKQVRAKADLHREERKSLSQSGQKAPKVQNAEFLSGFYKTDKLVPVITLVIHFGPEEWDGPMCLRDMLEDSDESLLEYIQDYRVHLIDPAKLSEDDLKKFNTSLGDVLGYIKHSKTKRDLKTYMAENPIIALEQDVIQVLQALTGLQVEVDEGDDKVELCGALKEWSEDERREGKIEVLHSVILKCLTMKGTVEKSLNQKIETETDPDLLDQWFTCALSCAGPEDFLEKISSNEI